MSNPQDEAPDEDDELGPDGQPVREWRKVQIRTSTYERVEKWLATRYPDPKLRPTLRVTADQLMNNAVDHAEDQVPPKPSPLDELATLGRKQ